MFTDHTSNPNKHRVNSLAMRNGSGVAGSGNKMTMRPIFSTIFMYSLSPYAFL